MLVRCEARSAEAGRTGGADRGDRAADRTRTTARAAVAMTVRAMSDGERATVSRRLTVGAELQKRRRRARSGLGARVQAHGSGDPRARGGGERAADGPRGRRALQRDRSRRARLAAATGSASTADAACGPIPARAGSPMARTSLPPTSIPPRSAGPMRRGRADADRPGDLRDARRHLHAGGHVGGGGRAARRNWRGIGITVDRDDADRRVSRPLRLGLRRRRPLRAGARLRHARRPAGVRRSRARARHRRHPRRRLQPPRTRRQLPRGVLARLLHRQVHERLGPRDQFRRAGAGARATSSRTRATGSTSSTSTACASTRRRTSRTRRRGTSSPTIVAGAREAAGAVPIYHRRRERAAGHVARRGRPSQAATAWMRCGTTTRTTPRSSR